MTSNVVNQKTYNPKPDEILLGYDMDTGHPHITDLKGLTDHFSVCGSPGSGMSAFNNTLIRQLLLRNCPVIYFNGKRSDANIARATYLAESADALSRLRVIDPLAEYGHHINPLASTREVGKLANKILNLLPADLFEDGAAHYRQLTYRNLVQLVDVLLATNKIFTYEDVLSFISHTTTCVNILKEDLSSESHRETLKRLSTLFSPMDTQMNQMSRQMREDMAGLEAQLQALDTLQSGKFLSSYEPTVTFRDSIQKNHFLFVQLPESQDKEQSKSLANILLLELVEAIGEIYNSDDKGLLKPCVVIMEDMPSHAQPILSLLMMQAREAGFAFMPFLHIPDSFQKHDRGSLAEFMEEVMGNCGRQYWLNINGNDGREWASGSFGKGVRQFTTSARPEMVHPSMFRDLKHCESLIYRDGRLRRVMLEQTYITPPADYNVAELIPKLQHHDDRSPLLLASRARKRLSH